ncbi:MAG: phosphoribosylanthranilate isomerase [Clostridia bacterium]|nr:phosphoribosylanthranilate isomerase [Clostridia bacterium]
MAKIKICGIRRQEDVTYVNRVLPEYIGFVFAKSKRQVTPECAEQLGAALDGRIQAVGVFVNEDIKAVVDIACKCRLNAVQIHGDETPEYISVLRKELDLLQLNIDKANRYPVEGSIQIWKAVRVKDISSITAMKDYKVDAFVLDTFVEGHYGGAGITFDWRLVKEAQQYGSIILAGGLNQRNVQKAVDEVAPLAVDISSGVESDGFKDEKKIRDFICAVRSYG